MNPDHVTILGEHDANTLEQMRRAVSHDRVVDAALMPDGHLGYGVPIGGVIAYDDAISPTGVGYDIGCGVMAVPTGLPWDELAPEAVPIAHEIESRVSFGLGRVNDEPVYHPVLESERWHDLPADLSGLKAHAAEQLGTVGSGNHYVDVLRASDGEAWVAVHFGSRGLGHKTATWFLRHLGASDDMNAEPAVIVRQEAPALFDAYVSAMTLAGEYAYAGREYVVRRVLAILGANPGYADRAWAVHNHHNYAWEEDGLWVVRKGATPLWPGQTGFVGGSMNDKAVVLEGVDHPSGDDVLWSAVHGAGRVMSRTQAAGKYKKVDGKRVRTQGAITAERHAEATRGITLRGGGYDESPDVYRKLDDVLSYMPESAQTLVTLQPRIVVMAGADVRDPYKD